MPSPPDQLRRAERRFRVTAILAVVALLLCGLWAGRPLPPPELPMVTFAPPPEVANQEPVSAALDPSVFSARLWTPPPPLPRLPPPPPESSTAAKPEATPQAAPLRLQLLAIIQEPDPQGGERFRAALYDPDQDVILIIAAGERIGTRTVRSVTARTVELVEGSSARTLELDAGVGPPPGTDDVASRPKGGRP